MEKFVRLKEAMALSNLTENEIYHYIILEKICPFFLLAGSLRECFHSRQRENYLMELNGGLNESELIECTGYRYFDFSGYVYFSDSHDRFRIFQEKSIKLNKLKIFYPIRFTQHDDYMEYHKFQGDYYSNQPFLKREFEIVNKCEVIEYLFAWEDCYFLVDHLIALSLPTTTVDKNVFVEANDKKREMDNDYKYALIIHYLRQYGKKNSLYTNQVALVSDMVNTFPMLRHNNATALNGSFGDASNAAKGRELKTKTTEEAKLIAIGVILWIFDKKLQNKERSILSEIMNLDRKNKLREIFNIEHPEIDESFLVGTLNTSMSAIKYMIDINK